MKSIRSFIVPVLLVLSGCDKLCTAEVVDQVKIQNLTARDLQLEVCKSKPYGSQQIEIPSNQTGEFKLGTRPEGYVKGGASSTGSCDRVDGRPIAIGIALTTRDFAAVRFCYRAETTADVVIVETTVDCPADTIEQTKPAETCGE